MKKAIIILISLVVVCNIIATISKPDADMDNESQLESEAIQETQTTPVSYTHLTLPTKA